MGWCLPLLTLLKTTISYSNRRTWKYDYSNQLFYVFITIENKWNPKNAGLIRSRVIYFPVLHNWRTFLVLCSKLQIKTFSKVILKTNGNIEFSIINTSFWNLSSSKGNPSAMSRTSSWKCSAIPSLPPLIAQACR